jgi:hypothetical protein
MQMKPISILTFALVISVLSFGFSARAQELTKEAKVERILALTNADAMMIRCSIK